MLLIGSRGEVKKTEVNVIRTWWKFPITEADHSVGEQTIYLDLDRCILPRVRGQSVHRNDLHHKGIGSNGMVRTRKPNSPPSCKLQDFRECRDGVWGDWLILSFFLSLTSPALSEWRCRPGECCRGTWSWQCSGKARRSRKWGRWRKRGWTPQLGPPPCGLVSQCDESSETCHNLKKKPTVSPTNLP